MVRITFLLGLLPLLASASPVPGDDFDLVPRETFVDCISKLNIPMALQSSPNFGQLSSAYNLRLKPKPLVVTIPKTTTHVSDTVKCAKKYRLKVSARGGGHSYSAQGLGGIDGSVIIDLQNFHDVKYDPKTTWAEVGGGARLGNIARKLYDQAKRGIPHGTCPAVGMGHPSLGGFGISSRNWGLMVDQIVQVQVVTADGSLKIAKKGYNSDLFWALKGAGPSFGIITRFWFKTYAVPENIVNYSYRFTGLSSPTQAADAFMTIQTFARTAPKELGLGVSLWGNGISFEVSGAYYGKSQAQFNTLFQPLLKKLPAYSSSTLETKGWIDTLIRFAGSSTLSVPETGYNEHTTFYAKSLVTSNKAPVERQSMINFFNYAANQGAAASNQGLPWFVIINLYGGGNSAITNLDLLKESSYGHRDTLWNFQFYTTLSNGFTPQGNVAAVNFLTGFDKGVRRSGDFSYVNYADPVYSRSQAQKLYYGKQLTQLSLVKKKWDKDQTFWYPQSIDPAK